MPQIAIAVEDLTVDRGGRPVLREVSCQVPAGQVTGLLGPSGSGAVTVLGRPAGDAALRSRVGYVTQAPSLYADLSVRDNLRYFATLVAHDDRGARIDEVLAAMGVADRGRDRVGQLSGGQRTRVSLACALVGSPALLVLDEPTGGLDPLLRRDLWRLFSDLARGGATLLVSSHVMDEAARCNRLLLLRDGRMVADDTPAAIRARAGTHDLEEAFLRLAEHQQVPA